MTDSRDQPDLETLNYKAQNHNIYCKCSACETLKRAAHRQMVEMGFNSVVVKPEARVNSSKVAGQPKGNHSSACASLNHPYADCTCVEQPNQNLMIIEEIEGLMSQVNEKIHKLTFSHDSSNITKKQTLWSQAIEEIDLFQKTTLFKLRKVSE